MPEAFNTLSLLPENGLDRSLHAPVFIGLLLLSGFREALGWSFAGLVVPGYLATVLLAAPVTGALVVSEAILTYLVALLLGRALPRTGAWFTFFGRERFLLLIACASLVRLAVEAGLLPALIARWDLTHSRELYSLGLVLVPLLGNSFWNAGFVRSFPRIGLVTGLTFLVVSEVLLPYTNFTLSRFQVANESVSLAFLESPHAHVILLIGAILGARNNVLYGWDYNGILVPALLAVAWYQPTKVATTLLEALVVYYASLGVVRLPLMSRVMIVGSRRVVLTFTVGFVIKYLTGTMLVAWLPHVQLIDFFGFGYLLPSLLANKIWDRGSVANVIMPTLHVSLMAFPLGTLLGFALRSIDAPKPTGIGEASVSTTSSVAWSLMLGDTAPSPHQSGTDLKLLDPYGAALELASRGASPARRERLLELAARARLKVEETEGRDWLVLTPSDDDPNADGVGPRVAFRPTRRYGDRGLIAVASPEVGSPAFHAAELLADRAGAAAIVAVSRIGAVAVRDEELVRELAAELELDYVLELGLVQGESGAVLSARGQLPSGLSTGLLRETLGVTARLSWQGDARQAEATVQRVRLSLPRATVEELVAARREAPDGETWRVDSHRQLGARLRALSVNSPERHRVPEVRERRLYGTLLSAWLAREGAPSAWQRAAFAGLGMRLARVDGAFEGWVAYEPEGTERRGHPTLLRRPGPVLGGVMLTLAAPRWQAGGLAAATRLYHSFSADALLVHGALVSSAPDGSADPRRPQGRTSYYQRAFETWLNGGGRVVILRGIPNDRELADDAVVAFDTEVTELYDGPDWTRPLSKLLQTAGVELGAVDGTSERSGLEASRDPGVSYARRFASGRSMVLWMSSHLRSQWALARTDEPTRRRLSRASLPELSSVDALPSGLAADSDVWSKPGCLEVRERALGHLERYQLTRNPHHLEAALERGASCGFATLESRRSETVWLALPRPGQAAQDSWLALPLSAADYAAGAEPPAISAAGFDRLAGIRLGPVELAAP